MVRRRKTFGERRQELVSSLNIVANAIRDCEDTGEIYPLRVVATQLRALIADRHHPLLLELTEERDFPLIVYTTDPAYTKKILNANPIFYSTGDALSLEKDEIYPSEMILLEALNALHVVVADKNLSLWHVIRMVADTEAAHYDLRRPVHLDDLDRMGIGGLPSAYRTIYNVGKVVCELGYAFIRATN